jgi:hypothetical protein
LYGRSWRSVGPVGGWLYKGLGLFVLGPVVRDEAAQLLMPNEWSLTHLNTGHQVCRLIGSRSLVFRMGKDIADCTEWELFTTVGGWANVDPDLNKKVADFKRLYGGKMILPSETQRADQAARYIANKRDV